MNHTKTAAAVAGSVLALGAATPAFAADSPVDPNRMSLDGGLATVLEENPLTGAEKQSQLLGDQGPLSAAKSVPLVGGLPVL
ncbi:hypothetical protein [Streptomyces boncukensis]|uniref:Secreted protein n=1 Tax=Streptomyces boncukensis TaxID=2711219 RepID=A0A6G4WX03_9ACTN|nr:hypothetical protein [Streptomyces boncukensis]NGO69816.1 hypothetical protein [Streptomyces boncukensis]